MPGHSLISPQLFVQQRRPRRDRQAQIAEALMKSGSDTSPVGHPLQALARLVQAGVGAYLGKQSADQDTAANDALVKGLSAKPFTDPDTGITDPGQKVGGLEGALTALGGLQDNPRASEMVRQLMLGKLSQKPRERFTDITGPGGNVTGQRSELTNRLIGNAAAVTPQSAIGKLRADQRGGFISPETASAAVSRATAPQGGVTQAQTANNQEITAARQRILALRSQLQPGQTLRDLIRVRIQKTSNTGRAQVDYDPFIEADFRTATQALVGRDDGFGTFRESLGAPAPKADEPPRAAAKPDEPGPFDRATDFVSSLFGGDDANAAATSNEPLDLNQMHGDQVFTPLPRSADQRINESQLRPGQIYDIPGPDGTAAPFRWNGQNFEPFR